MKGPKPKDKTGNVYGSWTVLKFARKEGNYRWWLCQCICGTTREVRGHQLGTRSTSCGCKRKTQESRKVISTRQTTHGRSKTKLYVVWSAMKKRCNNPNDPAYKNYGGRGIKVCKRWQNSFENFLKDMGECPKGLTLERKNNSKGYSPSNCCWATRTQQANNRRKSNARNT